MSPATLAPAQPVPACPDCGAPLTGSSSCPACGLQLTGPEAARLWEVDLALLRLDAERVALQSERRSLLGVLRGIVVPNVAAVAVAAPVPAPTREQWTPQRIQNLLLLLGGLLLATAATVFTAVTYDRLGAGGRAAVLLALTALVAAAAPRLRARGLGATAETLAAVALALAALDAYGLRRLGVGDGLETTTWLAASSATLAVLAAGYDRLVPLRLPRLAAVALLHAAALFLLARLDMSMALTATALVLLAAVDLAVVVALAGRSRPAGCAAADVHAAAACSAALLGAAALVLAVLSVPVDPAGETALSLCALAALAAGAAVVVGAGQARIALSALPVVLLAGAALVLADGELPDSRLPLVAVTVALLSALTAGLLARADRTGPLLGACAVATLSVLAVGADVVQALLGPASWLVQPWQLPAGTAAARALTPDLLPWTGSAATLLVLLAAAATAVCSALLVERPDAGTAASEVLAGGALLLLPVMLPLGHGGGVALLLALAGGLLAAGIWLVSGRSAAWENSSAGLPVPRTGSLLLAVGTAALLLASSWSLADRATTLVVLPVATLLLTGCALCPLPSWASGAATGLAGLAAGATVLAVAAARGLSVDQAGALLLVVPAALLALARPQLDAVRRRAAEATAAVLAVLAVGLAAPDPGWLSWTLTLTGVGLLAGALAPDRRLLAPVGALLLSASSWVRLAEAGVDAPEPYVLPVAVLALLLGHLRTRGSSTRSHAAYGPGLALLLVPSALACFGEDGLVRPFVLGAVALAVLLVGAHTRLQAPLVYGGGTLAVVALDLLAPYAAAVPRWTALAGVGTLLVVVGATFEQRRREVLGLKDRYEALR